MASDEFLMVVLVLVGFGIVCWYLLRQQSILANARMRRVESMNRLIEKFATAKEVAEFLETEQGKKLLEDPLPPSGNPRLRSLRFVRRHESLSKVDFVVLSGSFAVILLGLLGVAFWKWDIIRAWFMNASSEPATNLPLYLVAGSVALIWLLTEEMFMNER